MAPMFTVTHMWAQYSCSWNLFASQIEKKFAKPFCPPTMAADKLSRNVLYDPPSSQHIVQILAKVIDET